MLLVAVLVPRTAQCRREGDKASPEALLARARSEEILWTEGTPPTVMRAVIQVASGKSGWVDGSYGFYWTSPSQWREEIKLGTYYRTRVGGEKGYWQASNRQYQPEVEFELDRLLSVEKALRIVQHGSLSKVRVRRRGAVSQDCSEVKGKFGRVSTLCFDGSTGELLSLDYPEEPGNPYEISRIEYSSFKKIEGKSIPFQIQAYHGRNPAFVVTITRVEAMPEHDAGLFQPPAQSEFWASCDDVTDPELTHMVFPDAPRPVEFRKSITLYLVVETDGSPSHIAVIQGQDPGLEAAALAAARQWRYKPAMCGQTPVRQEVSTTLTVGP